MGVFDWLKDRLGTAPAPANEDPVQAWDRRIDALARRGAELRKSAATLLAVRGELERSMSQEKAKQADAEARLQKAEREGKSSIVPVLKDDVKRAKERVEAQQSELERVNDDAAALAQSAKEIEKEAEGLRRERASVAARLVASKTVSVASKQVHERMDEVIALDRARDEVERAHALAEICREDLKSRG